jgi:hypothetical protein
MQVELTGTPQNGGVVLIKAAACRLALLVSRVAVLSSPSHGREQPGTSSSLVTGDEREAERRCERRSRAGMRSSFR